MKRKLSFFPKHSVFAFLLTLLIGLWAGGAFERYVLRIGFVQNFSTAEATRLLGKTVREVCYENQTRKSKSGKIIGYSRDPEFVVRVKVKWNENDGGIFTGYPKGYFSNCIEVVE